MTQLVVATVGCNNAVARFVAKKENPGVNPGVKCDCIEEKKENDPV
jgi:hypothetical protein